MRFAGEAMPRGPRLDAEGALHHVMGRGVGGKDIFRSDRDRADFTRRLGELVIRSGTDVYAWCLMPNHFHLLLRTGKLPLSRLMRRLLTGYAIAFNLRHDRSGHVFQNRFKSIVVEEDPYYLELIRYIHLNPVRGGLVEDMEGLKRYPWTGHRPLLGLMYCSWQAVKQVLARFHRTQWRARREYHSFVASGIGQGRRPELTGGGLLRSVGGLDAVRELRQRGIDWISDTGILGSSQFAKEVLEQCVPGVTRHPRDEIQQRLEEIVASVARETTLTVGEICSGCRRRSVVRARVQVCIRAVRGGVPVRTVAQTLNVSMQTVLRAL